LSLDELEAVLRHWEFTVDAGRKWTEEDRQLVIDVLTEVRWSKEQWMEHLVPVPVDVVDRYRKVMGLLFKSGLISSYSYDEELRLMVHFSPATLARRGREFADWYRQSKIDNSF
jgi:hypothetical protein